MGTDWEVTSTNLDSDSTEWVVPNRVNLVSQKTFLNYEHIKMGTTVFGEAEPDDIGEDADEWVIIS